MSRLDEVERRCQGYSRFAVTTATMPVSPDGTSTRAPITVAEITDLARDFRVVGEALRVHLEWQRSFLRSPSPHADSSAGRALAVYDAWLNEETPT